LIIPQQKRGRRQVRCHRLCTLEKVGIILSHDVHLARLEDETDLDALGAWMDWSQPTGLDTPPPAVFLGGTHEMQAGETAYFTVTLEPGRYAWIAEVPNPASKNMLKSFTIPVASGSKWGRCGFYHKSNEHEARENPNRLFYDGHMPSMPPLCIW